MLKISKSVLMFVAAIMITFFFYIQSALAASDFYEMDDDDDRQVSENEWDGSDDDFKQYDRNNDGYITEREARRSPLLRSNKPIRQRRKPAVGVVEEDDD